MRALLPLIMWVGFIAMGVAQMLGAYDFFRDYWEWGKFASVVATALLSYIPVIGSIFGFLGAIHVWELPLWVAIPLFFWWPCLLVFGFLSDSIWWRLPGFWAAISKKFLGGEQTETKNIERQLAYDLCLFGVKSKPLKNGFSLELWIMRIYFFMVIIGLLSIATIIFLFSRTGNITIHNELVAVIFFLLVSTLWALREIARVKVRGFIVLLLFYFISVFLAAMRITDTVFEPRDIIGFLFCVGGTWAAWRVNSAFRVSNS